MSVNSNIFIGKFNRIRFKFCGNNRFVPRAKYFSDRIINSPHFLLKRNSPIIVIKSFYFVYDYFLILFVSNTIYIPLAFDGTIFAISFYFLITIFIGTVILWSF